MSRHESDLGLDEGRCRRRNRLASLRDHADSTPLALSLGLPAVQASDGRTVGARGVIYSTEESALQAINARREGLAPLTPQDVHLVTMEAGHTDRGDGPAAGWHLYLGKSTIKNVAEAGRGRGISLMNSHRLGSMSTPTELPYGRIYNGRWEKLFSEDPSRPAYYRAILQGYMLRGIRPNGDQGPSTDDLARMIHGGTLTDVSLGLAGGDAICDVCGKALSGDDPSKEPECPHIPGTTLNMSRKEIMAQANRGVSKGVATFTLHDAHPGEVSAVYRGALPGAGFRQATALARAGRLSELSAKRALDAYAGVALSSDFAPRRRSMSVKDVLARYFRQAQDADGPDEIDDLADAAAKKLRTELAAGDTEPARVVLRGQAVKEDDSKDEEIKALKERVAAQEKEFALQDEAEGKKFGIDLVTKHGLQPTELQSGASKLLATLRADDRTHPLSFRRADLLQAVMEGLPVKDMKGDRVSGADLADLLSKGHKLKGGSAPAEKAPQPDDLADLFFQVGRNGL